MSTFDDQKDPLVMAIHDQKDLRDAQSLVAQGMQGSCHFLSMSDDQGQAKGKNLKTLLGWCWWKLTERES